MSSIKRISVPGKSQSAAAGSGFDFAPVEFTPRKWVGGEYKPRYHIYKTDDDDSRVTVEADSALEAIRLSGIERPYKVERGQNIADVQFGVVREGRLTGA